MNKIKNTTWAATTCLLVMLVIFPATGAHAAAPIEQWVRRYSQPISSTEQARKVVTDSVGNVIVAGNTGDLGDTGDAGVADMLIIKYSGAGVPLWTNRYDGPARSTDDPTALAVDGDDNVFVTGKSLGIGSGFDYATIAYSSAGGPLWTNRFNGPGNNNDTAQALAVDADGNVLVTGTVFVNFTNNDYATIKYSGTGVPLWTNRHDGPYQEFARSLAVDSAGNVFVTGYEERRVPFFTSNVLEYTYATVAYSGAGAPLWVQRYKLGRDARPNAITVDRDGNVFVTGTSGSSTLAYSGAGVLLWTNLYGGSAIAADKGGDGNVFVTGSLNGDYGTVAYSKDGTPLWTHRYNGPAGGTDQATAIAVDHNGNVLVTGYSAGPVNNDYATIAYTGGGIGLWTNRYRGDGSPAMAVDGSGNAFVTGSTSSASTFDDWITIGYSTAGVLLWTNRYNGRGNGSDGAAAVAVDTNGNVFVTGTSNGDYLTTAYSGAGVPLWTNRYNGGTAAGIAVDANGNVFVIGTSSGEYLTIAYSGAGVPLWTNRYPGAGGRTDLARAVVVDGSGNVLVAVPSGGRTGYDYATIKYSGAGVPLWTNRYDGIGYVDGHDFPNCMAVDASGNVFVAGFSYGGGTLDDFLTIKYSSTGVPLWTNRININRYDSVNAIAVASNGNVIITGSSYNEFTWEYVTMAFSGNGTVLWARHYGLLPYAGNTLALNQSGNVFVTGLTRGTGGGDPSYAYVTLAYSSAGVPLWTNTYSGPQSQAAPADIAVDRSGNVIVTGYSLESGGGFDYLTLAYSGAGMPLWTNRYSGLRNGDDRASALTVGPDGAIYVTGTSGGDYATIKYITTSQLSIRPLLPGAPDANLSLWAAPNSSWTIQRTLQVSGAWTNVGTVVTDTNGLGLFQDAPRPASGAFYRARQP